LPILAKLESEIPGLRVRLMGLRCTHLVSTRKPDTRAFFGFKPRRIGSSESGGANGGTEETFSPPEAGAFRNDEHEDWQRPYGELVNEYELGLNGEPLNRIEAEPSHCRHGKEIVPNPKKRATEPEGNEKWWECPICGRPQEANEKALNDHVDLCLSRQIILETVQKDSLRQSELMSGMHPRSGSPSLGQLKASKGRKRGRASSDSDPRQKKLSFG
jgi:DNA polymerase kappa